MDTNIKVSLLLLIEVYVCLDAVTVISNMCGEKICCAGFKLLQERCIECPQGSYGINCTAICPDGYYGPLCREKCPLQCNETCNKTSGSCQDHSANQNPQQSNGIFYENDEASIKNSTSEQPPPPVLESNKPMTQEQVEYSKVKKCNSRTRKNDVSKEITSHQEYSDDSDDMFDSDEFEDSIDLCSKVQISDLPKTSQPEQQSMRKPNEAYGSIWL